MPTLKVGEHEVHLTVDELRELMAKEGRKTTLRGQEESANGVSPPTAEWTIKAVRSFISKVGPAPKTCALALVAFDEWVNTKDLAEKAAVKPKGMGSILNTLLARARGMGLPDPFEIERNRVGKNRSTRLKVSAAYRAAAWEVAKQEAH